jgi:hypothetical protein
MTKRVTPHRQKPKLRVSDKIKAAIDLMVWSGRKRTDAALAVGLDESTLRKALKRPEPLAYLNGEYEALQTSARARTLFRAEDLADNSKSAAVRFQANAWIAGVDGVSPVAKGEIQHRHSGLAPGLTIVFPEQPSEPVTIDGTATELPARPQVPINRIGAPPRPHPSLQPAVNMKGPFVPHPSLVKQESGK